MAEDVGPMAYCNKCGWVGTVHGESNGVLHPGCDYLAIRIRESSHATEHSDEEKDG